MISKPFIPLELADLVIEIDPNLCTGNSYDRLKVFTLSRWPINRKAQSSSGQVCAYDWRVRTHERVEVHAGNIDVFI